MSTIGFLGGMAIVYFAAVMCGGYFFRFLLWLLIGVGSVAFLGLALGAMVG
jgi:hypothetical protein